MNSTILARMAEKQIEINEMNYQLAEALLSNLVVFNHKTGSLDEVDYITMNGNSVQLNVEVSQKDKSRRLEEDCQRISF